MLKRTLFFFGYILFFILVPACVYFSGSDVNPMDELIDSQQALYDADDSLVNYENDSLQMGYSKEYYDDLGKTFIAATNFVRTSIAVAICFTLSILLTFFIALLKFLRPKHKTAGLITALCIFNVFYIPVFVLIIVLKTLGFAYYFLIMAVGLMGSTAGKVILIILFLLFIATIILAILGKIKGKRLAEIPSEIPIN